MNRKLNVILNTIEFISVISIVICILTMAYLKTEGLINDLSILKNILFYTSIILEFVVITIEALLFMVYKKLFKYIYVAYIFIEIITTIIINIQAPFYGVIAVMLFSFIKSFTRIYHIAIIYNRTYFRRYCKLFNINLSTAGMVRHKKKKKSKAKKRFPSTSRTAKSYA